MIRLDRFIGEIPRLAPRYLPDFAAAAAFDVRLNDGALTPVRDRLFITSITSPPPGGFKTFLSHDGDWLAWADHVNAVPGPVATDRLYYTGDGVPKMRVPGGTVYDLKVPKPSQALIAASGGGGSAATVTRVYVFTYVTGDFEESEPSAASNSLVCKEDETITLSNFPSVPSGRNITKQRIYRSQTAAGGATALFFLHERNAGTGNYVDSAAPNAVGEPIPSVDYNQPPDTLAGIVGMPNGMMAAFVGKDLYFCEPYLPHAWPVKYVLTCDFDIVALSASGTTLLIGTTGQPYVASGTHPATMQLDKVELNEPCINAKGMVDLGSASAYPSPNGLVVADASGVRVVSRNLFTREGWQKLDPASFVAGQYNGRYFASYAYTDPVLGPQTGTAIIDLSGEQPFLVQSRITAQALWHDIKTGQLYMLDGGQNVWLWDAPGMVNRTMTWRSKPFVGPAMNYGCIKIESDATLDQEALAALAALVAEITAANALLMDDPSIGGEIAGSAFNEYAINGDALQQVPAINQTATVSVYADNLLKATVAQLNRPVRLPGGFLASHWHVEVTADLPLTRIILAKSPTELRALL